MVTLTKCAARALDFDARLVPSRILDPVTRSLDAALRQTATHALGQALTDDEWCQLQLPGPLGGCGLRLPSTIMAAAYWASWATHEQAARGLSEVLGRDANHSIADAEAGTVTGALLDQGIVVVRGARPVRTDEAEQRYQDGPWHADRQPNPRPGSATRYMGLVMQLIEGDMATCLWTRKPKSARTKLLSAGGAKTGTTWTAAPDAAIRELPDAHWRCITRDRVGMLRAQRGARCGLPRSQRKQGVCGKPLDPFLHHVWHCRTAVARLRIHNGIGYALAKELRAARGNVDIERAMPDLAVRRPDGALEEGIMDLTCWFPGGMDWNGIDVTVRYPGATRYYGSADHAGKAANKAEAEKARRYGESVIPMAFETGGRLGTKSSDGLKKLAMQAAESHGGLLSAAGLENRWRRSLEAALFFGVADALLMAVGGSQASELAKERPAPAPAAAARTAPAQSHRCTQAQAPVQDECPSCELEQEIEGIWMDDLGHQMPDQCMDLGADEEAAIFLHGSQTEQATTFPGQVVPGDRS